MKKKIVYISGAEIFDVADVRGALDEVRSLLNLDRDTILFGIPVDAEAVELNKTDSNQETVIDDNIETETLNTEFNDVTPEITAETEYPQEMVEIEISEIKENLDVSQNEDAPVVPILSVLSAKNTESVVKPETIEGLSKGSESIDEDGSLLASDEIETMNNRIVCDLYEDVPEAKVEKTLEELLETMAPLREDVHPEVKDSFNETPNIDETDVTLENLAGEFAQAEDEIPVKKKSTERGKIGKLKNILPFTKKKSDDSGLMGDLFGWADIAANDEDFSMPGFFANARK